MVDISRLIDGSSSRRSDLVSSPPELKACSDIFVLKVEGELARGLHQAKPQAALARQLGSLFTEILLF